jgi:hypothetical protein
MSKTSEPLLTLEPLLEAVREGVLNAGWELSGLQKTTSHQFEGRWDGESSRSAYLFFHNDRMPEFVSVDVFLDETTQGLRGNLALVVEGPELSELGTMQELFTSLAKVGTECMPDGYRTPITVRMRVEGPDTAPGAASSEVRLKLHIPAKATKAGSAAVSVLASSAVAAFERVLAHPDFDVLCNDEHEGAT